LVDELCLADQAFLLRDRAKLGANRSEEVMGEQLVPVCCI
jgi:hypothetical protein